MAFHPLSEHPGLFQLPRERLGKSFGASYSPPPATLDALGALLVPRRLKRGQTLIASGHTDHLVGWLDHGLVRLYYQDDKGQEYTKLFFRPGMWFLTGFEQGQASAVSLQASSDAVVWVTRMDAYRRLFESDLHMALAHTAILSRHIAFKHWREVAFLTLSGTERYQRFITQHADWADQIPLSHIASHIGVTPTQLSRIRRKLGLIAHRPLAPAAVAQAQPSP